MQRLMTLATVFGLTLVASYASAQSTGSFVPSTGVRGFYGNNGWGSYGYHSSTAAEGWLRGKGALIEAQGQYNRDTAAAAIDYQQARSLDMTNDKASIDTYFATREMNRKFRAAERGPRPTQEDLIRHSKVETPRRLNRYELDPVFGGITWPTVLQGKKFEAARNAIETAFRHRDLQASNAATSVDIHEATTAMETELKGMIASVNPSDYVQAKGFLRSLSYEARQAPEIDGVASANVFNR